MSKELQEYWAKTHPYEDINSAPWFKDIVAKACEHSERHQNRIFVYFSSEADFNQAAAKCQIRNISYMGYMYNTQTKTYRLDIMMNWKERRPSRLKLRQPQKLD